jgi:FtsP/CotA-like multicopper oxidase with cupredoxin domain
MTATPLTSLTIAPGERADILIDFSNVAPGSTILVRNTAKAPFPKGAAADPRTIGQLLQLRVTANAGFQKGVALPATLPALLNPTLTAGVFPNLPTPSRTRVLTLAEAMGALGPLEVLLDGQKWMAPYSENPINGATEEWQIVNPTADSHPIHLHLVQFQLVSRQKFNVRKYTTDWAAANSVMWPLMEALMSPTQQTALPLSSYLQGQPKMAPPNEQGWKDTIIMNPGEVTTIRVRWAQQDGNPYTFDPTVGPGYVWHCHILEHEDNEMMRPYQVSP